MKTKALITLLCVMCASLNNCCDEPVFTFADFPIAVATDCMAEECSYVDEAISDFNKSSGLTVFELVQNSGQINISFTTKDLANAIAITDYCNAPIEIVVEENTRWPECVIQHEFGHALGLHAHFEERPNLISSIADCNTASDHGTNDYFELYYEWFEEKYLK